MAEGTMHERGRGLEDAFFARESERLRTLLRDGEEHGARAALATNSGISDDAVLDGLEGLDVTPGVAAALALVPLVGVAWADGEIQEAERAAILRVVDGKGVHRGTLAHDTLSDWLVTRPDPGLYDTWHAYMVALCSKLDARAVAKLREEVMGSARSVAKVSGGVMGLGSVSPAEKRVLESLQDAFYV